MKQKKTQRLDQRLVTIGWREWLSLPSLGVTRIKAKIDTGARTSALHAFDIHQFESAGHSFVRFKLHPQQRTTDETIECTAPLVDRRLVKSSSGHSSLRPVILAPVCLGDYSWLIELTLTNRAEMGFRMLLGRQAICDRFVVHAGRSFIQSTNL